MLNLKEDREEYFELIAQEIRGLNYKGKIRRLARTIVTLCDALEQHGRDTYRLLQKALDAERP